MKKFILSLALVALSAPAFAVETVPCNPVVSILIGSNLNIQTRIDRFVKSGRTKCLCTVPDIDTFGKSQDGSPVVDENGSGVSTSNRTAVFQISCK